MGGLDESVRDPGRGGSDTGGLKAISQGTRNSLELSRKLPTVVFEPSFLGGGGSGQDLFLDRWNGTKHSFSENPELESTSQTRHRPRDGVVPRLPSVGYP